MKELSWEDLNQFQVESAEHAYDRIYVRSNLQHACDFEFYKRHIYPYTVLGKSQNE